MNIEKLLAKRPAAIQNEISEKALKLWSPGVHAEADANTISILDVIGEDFWGEGVTAKRIHGALRAIGSDKPVTVLINSPGGDMFEGLAIHSLLANHEGKVTVKVLGLAASAASVIAMAGDEVQMAKSSFLMIHNAWVVAAGNRHDMRAVADFLEPFDAAMAELYADRTGLDAAEVTGLLDDETWLSASDAIDKGFAEGTFEAKIEKDDAKASAVATIRKIESAMAEAGVTRSDRRRMINELKASMHDAAGTSTPGAAESDMQAAVATGEAVASVKTMLEILK